MPTPSSNDRRPFSDDSSRESFDRKQQHGDGRSVNIPPPSAAMAAGTEMNEDIQQPEKPLFL